jgi:hypothetical protein
MGLVIKMEPVLNLNEASFCGCVFDLDDKITITNPIDVLLTIGWTSSRWALCKKSIRADLLICKAYSLKYQYPGCPILQSLANYILRCGGRLNKPLVYIEKNYNQWERENLFPKAVFEHGDVSIFPRLKNKSIGMNTRMLMEKEYKVPVDIQLKIEKHFETLKTIQPINLDCLFQYCSKDQIHYFNTYCRTVRSDQTFLQSDFLPVKEKHEFEVEYW